MTHSLDAHVKMVVKALIRGRVVPLLGAGVNLCARPEDAVWSCYQSDYLPSGSELARYLAEEFYFPDAEVQDLLRVSQYVAVMQGSGPLYGALRELFDCDYPPTPLHRFLAGLTPVLREKGYPVRHHPLIVTTNYDDLMERAFQAVGQAFDVVFYVADGEQRGKFLHQPAGEAPRVIERPNEYGGLSLERRPVVLKIHGAVDRTAAAQDSFVITEDHYIDYLTHTDISNLVPVTLAATLRRSHFLFLGYSLRDWNLRVILHRIWGEQKLNWKSWAIQVDPDPIEEAFWRKRGVDILDVDLKAYVSALKEEVDALPPVGEPS